MGEKTKDEIILSKLTLDAIKRINKFRVSINEKLAILLPEKVSAKEIAKKIRISATTNVIDHIDLTLTPYHNFPLELVGRSDIETIGMLGGTQCGKSVFLQLVVADTILQDPGTLIYTFPDEKSAKKAIEDKIVGMCEKTALLWDRVAFPKKRNLSTSHMRFVDMHILPAWAGSLTTLSATPAKRGILDEVRLMGLTTGKEGNAIELLRERLTTFIDKGLGQLYLVSTPSVEGDLLYQQLDKPFTLVFYWYSKCPACGKFQILDFKKNIKWKHATAKDAKCLCQFCRNEFLAENQKRTYSHAGQYGLEGQDGQTEIQDPHLVIKEHDAKHIYCWFSSLDSPFRTFKRIAQKFIEVKDKIFDYRNFWQSWLGRFWQEYVSTLSLGALQDRICDIPRAVVPDWCQTITAGGDTQDNGFYITFRAHGAGRRTHLLDSIFIAADMHTVSSTEVARLMKLNIEDRIFTSESGVKWQIGRWSFDVAGHRENEMKTVTSKLSKAIQIKGRNTNQNTLIRPSSEIENLYFARTYDYLEQSEIECVKEYWTLYNGVDDDYLTQFLNAQKLVETNPKTQEQKTIWGKAGQTDYRMAEIHNFITLDLPFSDASLRVYLEDPDWKYNPYELSRTPSEAMKEKRLREYENDFTGREDSESDDEDTYL